MNTNLKSKVMGATKNRKFVVGIVTAIGVAAIGIVLLMILSSPGNSMLPSNRNIFTLYDHYNMTVVIVFDEEPPTVQFIAPDRSRIDMKNIRYRTGSNFIQYFLPNAMPGNWRMDYDPLSNTEISTHYSVYMEHIFIRNFDVGTTKVQAIGNAGADDFIIAVSFEVSADEAGEFNYELHAVFTAPDNSIADEILLIMGYGILNEKLTLSVDAKSIRDMGGFMLRLTAYVRHGQASIQDTAWLDLRLALEQLY